MCSNCRYMCPVLSKVDTIWTRKKTRRIDQILLISPNVKLQIFQYYYKLQDMVFTTWDFHNNTSIKWARPSFYKKLLKQLNSDINTKFRHNSNHFQSIISISPAIASATSLSSLILAREANSATCLSHQSSSLDLLHQMLEHWGPQKRRACCITVF